MQTNEHSAAQHSTAHYDEMKNMPACLQSSTKKKIKEVVYGNNEADCKLNKLKKGCHREVPK